MGEPRASAAVIEPSERHPASDEAWSSEDEARVQKIRMFVSVSAILLPPSVSIQMNFVVLVPLCYNPDRNGAREPVERAKLVETEAEIRRHFPGYSRSVIDGWYRDKDEKFWDQLQRYEIKFAPDDQILRFLAAWQRALAARFHQIAIYMGFDGPVISL